MGLNKTCLIGRLGKLEDHKTMGGQHALPSVRCSSPLERTFYLIKVGLMKLLSWEKRCGSKSSSVELSREGEGEVVKREAPEYQILFMASANLWKRAGVEC
jgi:hypothetical protein